MLYEVAILEQPTDDEKKAGKSERLVLRPVAVVAQSDKTAAISAVLKNKDIEIDQARMVVLVRPFA